MGSCNGIDDLASRRLFIASDQLHFPDEDAAAAMFSDIPISSASQHDLQALLDQHQFSHHFASCSIRDCAWLTALSHSAGTSSGWLKAIPSISLGLAIPGPEFIVGLRLWLGVSLFPICPLCTCLSSIDCFGDHLLGCSHGPMQGRPEKLRGPGQRVKFCGALDPSCKVKTKKKKKRKKKKVTTCWQ